MMSKLSFTVLFAVLVLVFSMGTASAAVTKVGNADDGSDLENLTEIKSGPIYETRKLAVERLEKLNVNGIAGLGMLLPEVKRTKLYMASKNSPIRDDEVGGIFHTDLRGLAFARTFAEPHAATRFYPVAKTLKEDQLIALHIHEALHRALPQAYRHDENLITKLTMAMVSPDANHDRVKRIAKKQMGEYSLARSGPDGSVITRQSMLSYSFQTFTTNSDYADYDAMHELYSVVFPFGGFLTPVGIGLGMSLLSGGGDSQMGPLTFRAQSKIGESKRFEFGGWIQAAMHTLSDAEMKNSLVGRDVYTFGLSARRDMGKIYLENRFSYSLPGRAKKHADGTTTEFNFGDTVQATVHLGSRYEELQFGAYGEIVRAGSFKVKPEGGDETVYGRYHIVAAGPELSYHFKDFTFTLFGRFLVTSTKDADFEYLGNVLGQGLGQGSIGLTLDFNL
jgi:hypothetical protein